MTDRDKTISPPGSPAGGPLRRRTLLRPPKRASRRRAIGDMTVRGFTASTQRGYIGAASSPEARPTPANRARGRHTATAGVRHPVTTTD